MKILTSCLFGALLLTGSCLTADVFSLFPFRGEGVVSGVENTLRGSLLWTEEVDINGCRLELEVTLLRRTMKDVLRELRGQFKKGAAAMNSNSLLFEVPLDSGAKKRYYLVALNGMIPLLQFSLVLPADFRRYKGNWPSELPLSPGAVPQTVMRFPKRRSIYGVFHSSHPSSQTLADLTRNLENQGWKRMGQETASGPASGEIFLREDRHEILIVSVRPAVAGNSGSSAALYWSRLPRK